MKFNPIDLLSIPNILSYIRLILIPVFVNIYNTAKTPEDLKLAAAIIVASGLTDMLDGFIARRFHMITDIGKLIDPVADKLTQLAVLYCLTSRYDKMWILVGLCIIKEGYMAGKMVFT
ncbi:MAG: CDP-alcohol phosphatidyltransferase family protein, partial [Oscillospiraceae bacterium]|nr:CDP-alcohol phosphatidyltransferase family protein [Oscillospiraceae bacterium]